MRVDRRVGPIGRAVSAASIASGCLSGPGIVETTGAETTGEAGSTDPTSTSSTGAPTTTDPGSSTSTTGPDVTTDAPGCADGQQNGDETDVDCGARCPKCDDGQACAVDDDCAGGLCDAGACATAGCQDDADCAALAGPCTRGVCDPAAHSCAAAPDNEDEPCDDGDACTQGDACQAGACAPGSPLDCSAFTTACTKGECDPGSGACAAIDLSDGTACDDGDGCTLGEACLAGVCAAAPGDGALFHADFSDASGWTLDAPWQIGPAMASAAGVGGADPDEDHTETDDDGVAGTAIGGLDPLPMHTNACLTSPEVDTTRVAGTLWLSFWRHLHTPPSPGVTSRIEVWNGATWKPVQTGFVATVNDPAWTFQKFNVTGNAAPDFKVRFCVDRKAGSPEFAGWSVDDLTLAPIACTP